MGDFKFPVKAAGYENPWAVELGSFSFGNNKLLGSRLIDFT
jgi:hypothetical protein